MTPTITIGIIGDYNPTADTHLATNQSIIDASAGLGVQPGIVWLPTETLADLTPADALPYDALWCAPGSPYCSLAGALAGIRYARVRGIPFIGTCAGFQHAVIEYARNVLGFQDAQHAEYDPWASHLFINELACSISGQTMAIDLQSGTRAHAVYRQSPVRERYYCRFGLNPAYQELIHAGGLRITGRDDVGEARIVELEDHPFFIATLFVPQMNSIAAAPHPLIHAFVAAAVECRVAMR